MVAFALFLAACSGEDTDTTPVIPDPTCPAYAGLDDRGTTWSWVSTPEWEEENNLTSAWNVEVTAHEIDPSGDFTMVTVFTDGTSEIPDLENVTWTTEIHVRCDVDGAWLVSYSFDWSGSYMGFSKTGYTHVDYTRPDLIIKRGIGVGDSWTSSPVGVYDDSENGSAPLAAIVTRTVTAAEQHTVPAGTFNVLVIEGEDPIAKTETKAWLSDTAGSVEDLTGEVVAYHPFD